MEKSPALSTLSTLSATSQSEAVSSKSLHKLPQDPSPSNVLSSSSPLSSPPPSRYSSFTRWQRVLVVIYASFVSFMEMLAFTVYQPAVSLLMDELDTTAEFIGTTNAIYVAALGLFPLLWATLSDNHGRRRIYTVSLTIFSLANVALALAPSIQFIAGFRIVQGFGISSALAVGAGSISDIYEPQDRGTAMGLYLMGRQVGPLVGPIIGGYLAKYAGWRSIFWMLTGVGAVLVLVSIVALPETHRRLVEEKQNPPSARTEHKDTSQNNSSNSNNPLRPLKYLANPIVLMTVVYSMIIFGDFQMWMTSSALEIGEQYKLDSQQIGWTYMAAGVGSILGAAIGGRLTDLGLKHAQRKAASAAASGSSSEKDASDTDSVVESQDSSTASSADAPPSGLEGRLYSTWICVLLYPAAYVAYGWLVHLASPLWSVLLCEALFGFAMMIGLASLTNYLIDMYPTRSASINSVKNLGRSLWSVCAVQIAPIVQKQIGFGGAFTVFGGMALILGVPIVLVLMTRGERLRIRYPATA